MMLAVVAGIVEYTISTIDITHEVISGEEGLKLEFSGGVIGAGEYKRCLHSRNEGNAGFRVVGRGDHDRGKSDGMRIE